MHLQAPQYMGHFLATMFYAMEKLCKICSWRYVTPYKRPIVDIQNANHVRCTGDPQIVGLDMTLTLWASVSRPSPASVSTRLTIGLDLDRHAFYTHSIGGLCFGEPLGKQLLCAAAPATVESLWKSVMLLFQPLWVNVARGRSGRRHTAE